jgi:hypothetical protein
MRLSSLIVRFALPRRAKERLLEDLEALTAQALGGGPPTSPAAPFERRLRRFARTTEAGAEALRGRDDPVERAAVAARLHAGAFELGGRARRLLRVRGDRDALDTLCALYHHIGIEARRVGPSQLEVGRCLFADEFSPATCRLIAALDDGFAAGLAGTGRLVFTARITEGSPCCRARLEPGASS